jgi:hypothetical protein
MYAFRVYYDLQYLAILYNIQNYITKFKTIKNKKMGCSYGELSKHSTNVLNVSEGPSNVVL